MSEVIVVFSSWNLNRIVSFMEEEFRAQEEDFGFIRIDRHKGKETNRTIMLIRTNLYEKIIEKNYDKFKNKEFNVQKYKLRDSSYPTTNQTTNYFIPIPKELSVEEVEEQLDNKLNVLTDFGLFIQKPYLNLLKSRENNNHKGMAFVLMNQNELIDNLALARIVLHDTRWYKDNEIFGRMSCYWAKDRSTK